MKVIADWLAQLKMSEGKRQRSSLGTCRDPLPLLEAGSRFGPDI
jgi:hypothetical protein